MTRETIYERKPDYLQEVVGDEVLIYYPGAPRAVCMSRTAALVWSLCEGGATAARVRTAIEAAFPEAVARIAGDVEVALAQLVECGAVTSTAPAAEPAETTGGSPTGSMPFLRRPGFVFEVIDDEVLLYYPGSSRAVQMSLTAALVWSLCDGGASAGDITHILTEAYPTATEIARDVETTLAQLQECGALMTAGS